MPENIVNLIDKIAAVKGQDYAKGLVDMANLLAPNEDQQATDCNHIEKSS